MGCNSSRELSLDIYKNWPNLRRHLGMYVPIFISIVLQLFLPSSEDRKSPAHQWKFSWRLSFIWWKIAPVFKMMLLLLHRCGGLASCKVSKQQGQMYLSKEGYQQYPFWIASTSTFLSILQLKLSSVRKWFPLLLGSFSSHSTLIFSCGLRGVLSSSDSLCDSRLGIILWLGFVATIYESMRGW